MVWGVTIVFYTKEKATSQETEQSKNLKGSSKQVMVNKISQYSSYSY